MNETLTAEQKSTILASLQRYVQEHFDLELNDLQGTLLLDFIMKEIAPFAYNRGVEDARIDFTMAVNAFFSIADSRARNPTPIRSPASISMPRSTDLHAAFVR